VVSFTLRPHYPVPSEYEAGWAPEPLWTFRTRDNPPALARIWTPVRPARIFVTILTELYWFRLITIKINKKKQYVFRATDNLLWRLSYRSDTWLPDIVDSVQRRITNLHSLLKLCAKLWISISIRPSGNCTVLSNTSHIYYSLHIMVPVCTPHSLAKFCPLSLCQFESPNAIPHTQADEPLHHNLTYIEYGKSLEVSAFA
jgi:hypothetical protein